MSDDEIDEELRALLLESLGLGKKPADAPAETKVLQSAQYIYDNAIDVAIDSASTKAAASSIWTKMQEKEYSPRTWSTHELHPKDKNEETVNFIFTMDLLNFCFWTEDPSSEPFTVEHRGKRWTGYWSLVAALQRALEEGTPITSPDFWQDENDCTDEVLAQVFRSCTATPIPMLAERISCLRQAGKVLYENFNCSFTNCIKRAKNSAPALVNLLVDCFPVFRDESTFDRKLVRFYKRAQILVADIWACFEGESYGSFVDIDKITMFADYRVPQILHGFGCLQFSPPLDYHLRAKRLLNPGHSWEIQLRGCSIWCVELIRRQILRQDPKAHVNAILIDFFLYDSMKEREAHGIETIPHHRTKTATRLEYKYLISAKSPYSRLETRSMIVTNATKIYDENSSTIG